jgi:hypothetical protein
MALVSRIIRACPTGLSLHNEMVPEEVLVAENLRNPSLVGDPCHLRRAVPAISLIDHILEDDQIGHAVFSQVGLREVVHLCVADEDSTIQPIGVDSVVHEA